MPSLTRHTCSRPTLPLCRKLYIILSANTSLQVADLHFVGEIVGGSGFSAATPMLFCRWQLLYEPSKGWQVARGLQQVRGREGEAGRRQEGEAGGGEGRKAGEGRAGQGRGRGRGGWAGSGKPFHTHFKQINVNAVQYMVYVLSIRRVTLPLRPPSLSPFPSLPLPGLQGATHACCSDVPEEDLVLWEHPLDVHLRTHSLQVREGGRGCTCAHTACRCGKRGGCTCAHTACRWGKRGGCTCAHTACGCGKRGCAS